MTLDQKIEKFLETYTGVEYTPETFCEVLKISRGTFYNNRKKIEKAGIKFVHGSKGVSTRKTTMVTDKNIHSVKFTVSLFRLLLNHVNLKGNLQVFYTDVNDKLFKIGEPLSHKKVSTFIRKHMNNPALTQADRLNSLKVLVDLSGDCKEAPASEVYKITKAFKDMYSFTPEAEQVDAVYQMYQALVKGKHSFLQALAGTSKTTCINVLKHYMKQEYDLEVYTTSYTQMASSELIGGSTLHSLLRKYLNLDVINTKDEEILLTANLLECLGLNEKPIKMLVIDECTTLSTFILQAACVLAERVVFVGDKNQFKNNLAFLGPRIGSLSKQYRFLNSETSLQAEMTQAMLRKDLTGMKELVAKACVGTFSAKVRTRRKDKGAETYTDYKNSFEHLLDVFNEFRGLSDIVVAYSANACETINVLVNGGVAIRTGSKVVLAKAQYKPFPIPSGSFGQVVDVVGDTYEVLFEKGVYTVHKDAIALGYAVTSLKSQGSAWDNVLYIEGTAPRKTQIEDMYVCVTRARKTIKVLSRTGVNTKELDIHNIYDLEEGQRNVMLYSALKGAQSIARASGLEDSEIAHVASSAFSTKLKTANTSVSEAKPVTIDNNWGIKKEMVKTKEIDCDCKEAVSHFEKFLDNTYCTSQREALKK